MMKFNEKYSQKNFINFLGDFLPEDFSEKEEDIIIKKERYKEITKVKILGFSESLDLHVLEMDHTHENDPRIAIATDAFKILADHWIHQALVVFKNTESENYRLSYLTISLDLNDKNKAVKKYSNARRYSFYLGSHAKIRTPEQQLVKKGRVKDAADLLARFSVEVVNKQFYLEIAKHFDELVVASNGNLSLPGVSQEDSNTRKSFAVRLIGRLMFCWFLKQKKSASGQLIPDNLLSSEAVVENYYHHTVEPLFFEVLNTNIDSRGIRSELFDKVPYLNGGLFNPQTDDYYELDRGTFTSKYINTLEISDAWFRKFFELLETYNFTIDENTVFDQELSVDPEMLGRIFENLLAEINPETGGSERKRTGSFYTPRQVVEYMVDQSLIEYLKSKTTIDSIRLEALVSYDLNDDTEYPLSGEDKIEIISAIDSLKILDPACGSGAYPIGALQKIVYILQTVDPDCRLWLDQKLKGIPELYKQKIINEVRQNPFDYTRKLDVIKNSIFGVDIQPIAVDVSRLRCFLTLVVESEINDTKQNRGIEPLPNLDFKFVCANTLIGLPKTESVGLFDDHSGIIELSSIMSEYFSCNSQRKNEIKLKFTNVQKTIFEKTVSAFGKSTGKLTLELATWNPFSNASNSWFDAEWMFGLEDKFDVVIGNPPYIRVDELDSSLKEIYKEAYESTKGKYDLYYLFFEAGLGHLKKNGVLSFITPNKYCAAESALPLRNVFLNKNKIQIVSTSKLKVFDSASNYPVITYITKNAEKAELHFREALSTDKITSSTKNEYILRQEDFEFLPNKIIPINVSQDEIALTLKLLKNKKYLGGLISFSEGLRIKAEYETEQKSDYLIVKQYQFEKWSEIRDGVSISSENLKHVLSENSDRYIKIMKQKILIAEDALEITATIDDRKCIPQGGIYFGVAEDNYFVLGLLNSKLLSKIYKILFGGMHMGGGYLRYRKGFLECLPVLEFNKADREKVHNFVSTIIHENNEDAKNHIDELIMDLYHLTSDEKALVVN